MLKITNMYLIIGIVIYCLWVIYELWRAPLLEKNKDGSWRVIEEPKQLKNNKKLKPPPFPNGRIIKEK